MPEQEWENLRSERGIRPAGGISAMRLALLFGSAAIAFALIVTSFADDRRQPQFADADAIGGVDMMSTGSVARPVREYTLRKSVLQESPESVCVIYANGSQTGDC